ncbi:Uncharacterised protein [Leclercia adecarboxylata]|uniref:Uncharacterized protein n=1 Tax=Leclercia adecarboxylata TaxID=83655 RepID=A0A4U9J4E5_9ENTR|nr:Uncharacterised protein [Leclercia adecarboxylata]
MNDQAFTFQTLHPDTIMDALFEQGIRGRLRPDTLKQL